MSMAIAAFRRWIASRSVRFFKRTVLGGICALVLFYACTDIGDVSSPGGRPRSTRLSLAPRYSLVSGSYMGEPINRIRLTARNKATGEVVGTLVQDVTPENDSWNLALDVTLSEEIEVVISIELINVTAGTEAVQWSGVSAPISVAPTQNTAPATPVTLFQGPLENLTVKSIDITAGSVQLQEGGTTQFQATVDGPPTSLVVWNSRDASIVSINQTGGATALRNGSTWIVATAGPKADSVPVNVSQRVNSVTIAPDTARLATIGTEAVFSARVLDPRGADIANSGVTWSIANAAIADNLGSGRFRARVNGVTQVTATSIANPTISRSATLIVSQRAARLDLTPTTASLNSIGARQTFDAVVRDAAGNAVAQTVRWRSANNAIATVDNAGVATATGIGTTQITASSGTAPDTVFATASLQVTQAIASIDVSPSSASLDAVGDTASFTLTARDANNNIVPNVRGVWTSANPLAVSVDSLGRAVAVGNGNSTVTAQVGALRASVSVSVAQRVIAVAVRPTPNTLTAVGQQVQLTAAATDRRNSPVNGRRTLWTSSDTSVAVVDTTGKVTARRNGSTNVRAEIDGVAGSAVVNVNVLLPDLIVSSATFTPGDSIGMNDSTLFAFEIRNNGNAAAGASHAVLQLVNAAGNVVVDDTIISVPTLAAGQAFVLARWFLNDGDTGTPDSLRIRIVADSLKEVTESDETNNVGMTATIRLVGGITSFDAMPDSVVLNALLRTSQLTAQARNRAGAVVPTAIVRWFSKNPFIASVDSLTGLVTARNPGVAYVLAFTSGFLKDSVLVRVRQVPARITVTPPNRTIAPNDTARFFAQVFDSANFNVFNAKPTWSSSNSGVATVDSTGLARGVANGNANITATTANALSASGAISITIPDLVVLSVTVNPADSVFENDSAFVAVQIKNVGTGVAGASRASVRFFNAGTNALLSDTLAVLPVLGPNNFFTITRWLKPGLADSVRIRVVADTMGEIAESNETNNSAVSPIVHIRLRPVSLDVTPDSLVLRTLNSTGQLTATIRDRNNQPMTSQRPNWFSMNPGVVTVDSLGRVTAHNNGNAFVVATSASLRDSALVRVQQVAASLHITPTASTLAVNDTVRIVPTISDSAGVNMNNVFPTWTSSAPAVATVDGTGFVHATGPGNATITAQLGALTDTAHITVSAPNLTFVVDSITLVPSPLQEGDSAFVGAWIRNTGSSVAPASNTRLSLIDAANVGGALLLKTIPTPQIIPGDSVHIGTSVFISTTVNWTDSLKARLVADINGTVVESNEADNTIVSRAAPVRFRINSLGTSPLAITLTSIGDTGRISTNPTDRFGRALTGRVITFTSLNPTAITVNATGKVTALTADSAKIVVAGESKVDTVRVVVNQVAQNIVIVSGDNQINTVDQEVNDSLAVRVEDASHHGVAGVNVEWTVDAPAPNTVENPGPSVNYNTVSGFTPVITQTNGNGIAKRPWKLGTRSGGQSMMACIAGGICVTFNGKARADKAFKANKRNQADNQDVIVNRVAANALEITVLDKFDNPTRGTVVWSLGVGGHGSFTTPATVPIDTTTGKATVEWQLPTVKGRYTVNYAVKDETNTVVAVGEFGANAKPDKVAGSQRKNPGGSKHNSKVANGLTDRVELRFVDQFGNSVDNVPVIWSHKGGNGSAITNAIVTTDTSGTVAADWVLGTKADSHKIRIRAGIGPDTVGVDLQDDTKPASAKKHGAQVGHNQNVTVKKPGAPLTLEVKDEFDNIVPNARVAWLRNDSTDSFSPDTSTTDGAGIATVSYSARKLKGSYNVRGVVLDSANNAVDTVAFTINAKPDKPTNTSRKNPGASKHNSKVANSLTDHVEMQFIDQWGNTVDNVPVVWSHKGGNGSSIANAVVTTDADGVASADWVLGTKADNHKIRVRGGVGADTVVFELQDDTKPASSKKHGAQNGHNQNVTVKKPGAPLTLEVKDEFDNIVPNARVAWLRNDSTDAFSPDTSTTDANGIATVSYNARKLKGSYSVRGVVLDSANTAVDTVSFAINAKPDKVTNATRKNPGASKHNSKVANGLTDRVEFQFTDQYGNTVENTAVTWTHKGGNGSSINNANVTTDTDGNAAADWVLGTKADNHKIRVRVGSGADTVGVDLQDDTKPASAKTHGVQGGHNQNVTVKKPGAPLTLEVKDAFDNLVPNARVAWLRNDSTDSFSPDTSTTDGAGLATVSYSARKLKGGYSVRGVVLDSANNAVDTVSFSINARPDKPTGALRKNPGASKHNSKVASNLTDHVEMQFVDQYGNTVDNEPVVWSHKGGNGSSITNAIITTDADGNASADWVLGTKADIHKIRVRVGSGGDTTGVDLQDDTKPAAPKQKGASSGSNQTITVKKSTSPLEVEVKDVFDNLVPNARIAWQKRDTSEVFSPDTSVTNSAGLAWTLHTGRRTKGSYSVTGFVLDTANTVVDSVVYVVNTKADQPTGALRTNAGQSKHGATVGATLTDTVTIQFKDKYGNTVDNLAASWSKLEGDSSALGTADGTTDADGKVTAKWVLGKKAGRHKIKVQVDTLSFIVSDSTLAGPTKKIKFSQNSLSFTAFNDSTALSAFATDTFDNATNALVTLSTGSAKISVSEGKVKGHQNTIGSPVHVKGSAAGVSDSIPVNVLQAINALEILDRDEVLTELQFTKRLNNKQKDRNGNQIPDSVVMSQLRWFSRSPEVATIDSITGALTTISNDTTIIVAEAVANRSIKDSVWVVVKQAATAASGVTIHGGVVGNGAPSPPNLFLTVGQRDTFYVHGVDANNRNITRWTWSRTPTLLATFFGNANQQRDSMIIVTAGAVQGIFSLIATDPKGTGADTILISVVGLPQRPVTPVPDKIAPKQGTAPKIQKSQSLLLSVPPDRREPFDRPKR